MSKLDQLVAQHLTVGMAAAGFTKVGRVYRAVAETGDHAFVWYSESRSPRPDMVTFLVTASIVTTTFWAFLTRDEPNPGPVKPDPFLNSLVVDVEAPRHAALDPDSEHAHRRRLWVFDDGTRTDCGHALADHVLRDLAPWLLHRIDRSALLAEIDRPSKAWRGAPHGAVAQAVLALLDDGPLPEIERRLAGMDDVTPGRSLTAWITTRIDARREARDS